MKTLEHFGGSLVANPQAPGLIKPGHCMFDYDTENTKPRAMRIVFWSRQHRLDPARPCRVDVALPAVTSVAKVFHRATTRTSALSIHRWNSIQQRNRFFAVQDIRRRCFHRQRYAIAIDNHVPLASVLPTVRRIGAGVCPPKTARKEALSATAREKSNRPFLPNFRSSTWWSCGHTPARVHSFMRRQQVGPLGANSAGISPHAHPVRSTNRMPTKQARSSAGGRPPFGRGGRTGNKGCTSAHSSSVTHSRAMRFSQKEDYMAYCHQLLS